jgi:hypothetical protein
MSRQMRDTMSLGWVHSSPLVWRDDFWFIEERRVIQVAAIDS